MAAESGELPGDGAMTLPVLSLPVLSLLYRPVSTISPPSRHPCCMPPDTLQIPHLAAT
jgi:hypothetical protein